jgi:hypothetical protein
LIPNPILKVLSSIQKHRVSALLMGGQACVLYGAAEFSRDTDFALLASPANLKRLHGALADLRAKVVAIPPFEAKYLKRGHALHFRCRHSDALGLRVDVMSKMRGVDSFAKLWKRRTSIELPGGTHCEVMSVSDLVQAKKTQRDKDWPMIRRLMEAHYYDHHSHPSPAQIRFWLRELRTPELLREIVREYSKAANSLERSRPLLRIARHGQFGELLHALTNEEQREREKDRKYWAPLKRELEAMRRERIKT